MKAHGEHPRDRQTTLGGLGRPAFVAAALVGVAGLGAAIGLGAARDDQFAQLMRSYLVSFCFVLSLTLGAMFFVLIQHATRAGWSVTIRRLAEIAAANVPLLALLALPIIVPVVLGGLGVIAWTGGLYEWAQPHAAEHDPLLAHKAPYLNPVFFAVRVVFYFAVWWWIGRFYLRRSLEQDRTGDPALTLQMERMSPPALLLYAATVTFAAFDFLMSLSPHWFSTIYGVYFFSGAVVGGLAALILAAILLQAAGRLDASIHVEHYHDLGKLLFAFIVFWGYIAFSQYLLIWYGNIPEETIWYLARQTGTWAEVSVVLLFVHLLMPFCGLLSRNAKRSKPVLAFWAVWLLAAHWLDVYWLAIPSLAPADGWPGLIDVCCLLGVGGLYVAGLVRTAGSHSLTPQADPRLDESLAFENV